MKVFRVLALIAVVTLAESAAGQTLTILHAFSGIDGSGPISGLVQGSDGNFYGTASLGGASNTGTVFRISSGGTYTNLHSFNGTDGAGPIANLVQATDGNFYGLTYIGGAHDVGTVFRMSPGGALTNLYSFSGSDGANPFFGALVQGSDGNLYGTTQAGGTGNSGTVFRISTTGNFTNLYSFHGVDGALPYDGLARGNDGSFYGTTFGGGTSNRGTVFRITPTGDLTNLHSFVVSDGQHPFGGLVLGSDGNFYGTASVGNHSNGTVFRISPGGVFTNLHSFSPVPDGAEPIATLIEGSDGNFYGTTFSAGPGSSGTVFRISSSGSFTNLHSFNGTDGGFLNGAVMQGSDGSFYGTTTEGGTNNNGTVYRLTVPLSSPSYPINQITAVLPSGPDMVFGLTSVAGETYQLQASSSMNPTNWSNVAGVCVSNAIGATLTVTNAGGATGPQEFYRFAITP